MDQMRADSLPSSQQRRTRSSNSSQKGSETPKSYPSKVSSPSSEFERRIDWGLVSTNERFEYFRQRCTVEDATIDFRLRMMAARFILSNAFEWTFGCVVLGQLVLSAAETDYNAMSRALPTWMYNLQIAFVSTYVLELALRIYVWRWHFFFQNGNRFDLTVVALDLGALIAEAGFEGEIPSVAIFRCVRMLKLVRTGRILKQFRELYIIAHCLAGVLKSIFWESVVLFVVLTIASIVAVEIIHPINLELAADGTYDGCDRCDRAFESVMQSNLTFFQSMVAGDSWGLVIIPIIERRPETAFFFVFLTLLIVLGLMNLILSAIVDKASQVRHIVEASTLLEKRAVINESKLNLVSVCEELDIDKNGSFTEDELKRAIETPLFQEALQVMDLGTEDLNTIFGMMDADSSGSISYEELADALQRIKAQDDHFLLIVIQRTMKDCYKRLKEQIDVQAKMQQEFAAQRMYLQQLGQLVEEEVDTLEQVAETEVGSAEVLRQLLVARGHTKSVLGSGLDGTALRQELSRRRKRRLPILELPSGGAVECDMVDVTARATAETRRIGALERSGESGRGCAGRSALSRLGCLELTVCVPGSKKQARSLEVLRSMTSRLCARFAFARSLEVMRSSRRAPTTVSPSSGGSVFASGVLRLSPRMLC